MSAITFTSFFLLSLLGIPIAHALIVGSTLAMAASPRGSFSLIVEQMVSQVGSFPLLAIPFFMLTGSVMMGGTLGRNLLDFPYTPISASRRSAWLPRSLTVCDKKKWEETSNEAQSSSTRTLPSI